MFGALTLGACAAQTDVQSTTAFSNESGQQLPPVDDLAASSSTTTTTATRATVPGTRPADFGSMVLLANDLPGWDVVGPMYAAGELAWEAVDCPDMNHAWGVTGLSGTRSRGSKDGVAFRNTAVEFTTVDEARDVLDSVDQVSSECTLFESTLDSFWSEPIVMPTSKHRTSGLVIGSNSIPNWTLAYWQVGATVVILEVEGDEMWAHLDPLLTTLSARLDGNPTTINESTATTTPPDDLPVLVPATLPAATTSTTTTASTTLPQDMSFPPTSAAWAEHRLAHLAPAPGSLGPEWEYDSGNRNEARPADSGDAIEGCDAPVPPMLDGYEASYVNVQSEAQLAVVVGVGTPADSQTWIDAFRILAGCDLEESNYEGSFDLAPIQVDGVDDAVMIVGEWDLGLSTPYVQVLSAARTGEIVVVVSVTVAVVESTTVDAAIAQASEVLALTLASQ